LVGSSHSFDQAIARWRWLIRPLQSAALVRRGRSTILVLLSFLVDVGWHVSLHPVVVVVVVVAAAAAAADTHAS